MGDSKSDDQIWEIYFISQILHKTLFSNPSGRATYSHEHGGQTVSYGR